MKWTWVKKITLADWGALVGLGLMIVGLGVKMESSIGGQARIKYEGREKVAEVRQIVNINDAGKTELEALPAIGPVLAQKILDYRKNQGPFKSKEAIMAVPGIGRKTYEKFKDKIKI